MGKKKHIEDIRLLFEKSPVVSYDSIKRMVKNKGKSGQYAKKMIHYLLSKNRIKKITKGYYTIRDEASLAVFAFQPAYLGLQDSLSFHDLWEQETIPVIITTRKVRQGTREVLGQNVLIRRIKKKYFFGIKDYLQEGSAFPYSDIEKTFIDMIYFNETLDKNVMGEFLRKINRKKLKSYLKKYPSRFRKRVISFLSQIKNDSKQV